MNKIKRREFLAGSALLAGGALLTTRLAFAYPAPGPRFVFIILRGALDGLAAAPPYGDPDYARQRGEMALGAPGSAHGALELDGLFGLHPSLAFLRECYAARELIVFHALATPYRERSHFDGQDVLENGSVHPHAEQTGWLNRALAVLPPPRNVAQPRERGMALGQNLPLVMRGPAEVASWAPSRLPTVDEDTLQRIADLYSNRDAQLAQRFADALAADAMAGSSSGGPGMERGNGRYIEVVRAAAGFLKREDGPQVAVFDTTGWDTHANEGAAQGQLALRLAALDAGLRALKEELGTVWRDTAVLLATEFGRTAAINGTRGTDHGTASAAFLLGGAVRGGRVICDWPGLSSRALYEGRDLKPTLDLRSVLKGLLAEHLQVPDAALATAVFPDSAGVKRLSGLTRA